MVITTIYDPETSAWRAEVWSQTQGLVHQTRAVEGPSGSVRVRRLAEEWVAAHEGCAACC